MSKNIHKYKIKYNVDIRCSDTGFSKEEVEGTDYGLCDKMLLMSIVQNEDGDKSYMTVSADGDTGRSLDFHETFMAWSTLAYGLAEADKDGSHPARNQWQRDMVNDVVNKMRERVTGKKL